MKENMQYFPSILTSFTIIICCCFHFPTRDLISPLLMDKKIISYVLVSVKYDI